MEISFGLLFLNQSQNAWIFDEINLLSDDYCEFFRSLFDEQKMFLYKKNIT